MSKKNNVLTIRVPNDLKDRIEKAAAQQGVSMNQFALYAFTREIAELEAASYFRNQYSTKNRKEIFDEFDEIMDKIPRRRLPAWDKIGS
jgi:uncharacterized protein (DUF1778 family)